MMMTIRNLNCCNIKSRCLISSSLDAYTILRGLTVTLHVFQTCTVQTDRPKHFASSLDVIVRWNYRRNPSYYPRTNLSSRALRHSATTAIWNNPPAVIRSANSRHVFKRILKTHLFSVAFNTEHLCTLSFSDKSSLWNWPSSSSSSSSHNHSLQKLESFPVVSAPMSWKWLQFLHTVIMRWWWWWWWWC